MKNSLILILTVACIGCASEVDKTRDAMMGCWQLETVGGYDRLNTTNYVKYHENTGVTYWGSNTEYGFFMDSSEFEYHLEQAEEGDILMTVFLETDTAISSISIEENANLICTVLETDREWFYKRIERKELDSVIASAIDPRRFNGF